MRRRAQQSPTTDIAPLHFPRLGLLVVSYPAALQSAIVSLRLYLRNTFQPETDEIDSNFDTRVMASRRNSKYKPDSIDSSDDKEPGMKIPKRGMTRDQIFERLSEFRSDDTPWRDGRTFAYVFDPGEDVEGVIKQAYMMYLSENALDPTAFPSTVKMENEVVAMAASHLGGNENTVGNFTSGGTESIILAVKTARDHARSNRPDVTQPEMIVPVTGHAAFHKAAHYLDVKLVPSEVNSDTFKADVDSMRKLITDQTILLVGSAVSYAHCVVDPITDIAALATARGLLCHVDACMGGFNLPYYKRLGAPVPDFDLSVAGVTSISMDLHKYAFAAKGASVVLYHSNDLRRHQFFACAGWSGYTMINTTIQSSKSIGPLAAAWAVLNYVGEEGYLEYVRKAYEATKKLVAGIQAIDELRTMGEPEMNLIAFTSDEVNVFHIIDEMKVRGWTIQPQLQHENSQQNIHLSVNPANAPHTDDFLADLKDAVAAAKKCEHGELVDFVEGALTSLPDPAEIDDATIDELIAAADLQDGDAPDRFADINAVMNKLPPALRERLLVAYIGEMFRYREGA